MFLQFIKLSPVDVMKLCRCYDVMRLSSDGRSSSSVSQFLPSCS